MDSSCRSFPRRSSAGARCTRFKSIRRLVVTALTMQVTAVIVQNSTSAPAGANIQATPLTNCSYMPV